MTGVKKGLGRGLSALIPDSDMEFLSRVARDIAPVEVAPTSIELAPNSTSRALQKNAGARNKTSATGTARATPTLKTGVSLQEAEDAGDPAKQKSHSGTQTSLIVDGAAATSAASLASTSKTVPGADGQASASIEWILMEHIEPNPYQPRRTFSRVEMSELVDSIRNHGVLQPILVRPLETGSDQMNRFQLIAGERRWRAAQQAGLSRIPAICRPVSDRQALELAVIENVQRHDISAIDAALAYRRLADEFELSQESIARRVGKSRSAIANTLRLLDLPEEVKKTIEDGVLSEGHGRAILLASGEGARRAVFRRVLRDKLSVRDTERVAQASLRGPSEPAPTDGQMGQDGALSSPARSQKTDESDLGQMTLKLQKALGARLRVAPKGRGGRIIIPYASPEELERLAAALCK